MVSYGMVWYGMVWYGMIWHGMVNMVAPHAQADVQRTHEASFGVWMLPLCACRPAPRGGALRGWFAPALDSVCTLKDGIRTGNDRIRIVFRSHRKTTG